MNLQDSSQEDSSPASVTSSTSSTSSAHHTNTHRQQTSSPELDLKILQKIQKSGAQISIERFDRLSEDLPRDVANDWRELLLQCGNIRLNDTMFADAFEVADEHEKEFFEAAAVQSAPPVPVDRSRLPPTPSGIRETYYFGQSTSRSKAVGAFPPGLRHNHRDPSLSERPGSTQTRFPSTRAREQPAGRAAMLIGPLHNRTRSGSLSSSSSKRSKLSHMTYPGSDESDNDGVDTQASATSMTQGALALTGLVLQGQMLMEEPESMIGRSEEDVGAVETIKALR